MADQGPPKLFPVQQLWTLALNNALAAPTAYDNTHAYFSLEGDRLVAYELKTGARQWLVTARPRFAPVAGDGLLIIVEAGSLTALNTGDGSIAWQLPLTDKVVVDPVWDNGWLIVATDHHDVLAFRAVDGYLLWRHDLESAAHARPALAGDRVYVPTVDGRIVALDVETGEREWERRLGGPPNDVLALTERMYVGSQDNYFYCLMTKDGRVDWRWRTGGDVIGLPIVDKDRVYFVALDNVLRALDQKSGVQQWMRPLSIRPAWGPIAAGSTVLVAGLTPSVRGFEMKDGAPAGELPATGQLAGAPHAFEDAAMQRPMALVTSLDIAKGASAALAVRSFEPNVIPMVPLPNVVSMAPATPATPRQ
jgi:outer membrane protein assembly factor BamB